MTRTAQAIGRRAAGRKPPLPPLLFFTDPGRTPDIEAAAWRLPRGSAIVFRAFGAPDAELRARRLAQIAAERGLMLLIGADAGLAAQVGAHGVHLPERLAGRARRIRRTGWIVTAAAHSLSAARHGLASGADAVVVSAVFPSSSPSAGAPIGPLRLAQLARAAGGPVYALGGVNDKTARRLLPAGLVGLAAVEALRT
ncbi:thiamine phosphate synthase [Phenylobacterium sp. 58.2.17]|uniref:thiamine phosphate synthase n=1 Tax=Phenylobacterium sp. 58.2.17 TaxID=2969306 RepID=UPI002264E0A6|nr:thiamine phosphate synthase [Phenylobacterium sp. 58.2.17]MCX7586017.1 thiamine phosphate synthase [Phenylobacterium sp. 58.2.17]